MSNSEKTVICFNMINNKKCPYGNNCVYSHSLKEQKLYPLREKAYNILNTNGSLSHIDLIANQKLYESLVQLTKVCISCSKDICPGGYNCRYGAINNKYRICYDDLVYGNCKKQNCFLIHLTKRGLVPYIKQKNTSSPEISTSSDTLTNKPLDSKKIKKEIDIFQKLFNNSTILSKHLGNKTSDIDSDSEVYEDVDKMIDYFNDTNSDDESIFLV